jgi:hypothetical protein
MDITYNSLTYSHKAFTILSFIRGAKDVFLSLSRDDQWSEVDGKYITDTNPPRPSPSLTSIDKLVAVVRVYELLPALRSPCGSTYLLGERWHLVRNIDEVLIQDGLYIPSPTHLYVSCLVDPSYYQSPSVRVIGLHTDLRLTEGANSNQISFPNTQVEDQGVLHWAAYSTPIDRIANKKHKIELLIDL